MGLAANVLGHAPLGGQLLSHTASHAAPEGHDVLAVEVEVRLPRLPRPCDCHVVPLIVRPAHTQARHFGR